MPPTYGKGLLVTPAKAVRGHGTLQGSTATCWRDEAGRGAERQAGLGGASSASPPVMWAQTFHSFP